MLNLITTNKEIMSSEIESKWKYLEFQIDPKLDRMYEIRENYYQKVGYKHLYFGFFVCLLLIAISMHLNSKASNDRKS